MNIKKIKKMISNFSKTFNAFYNNPPSEENNYHNWPLRFHGEERIIAYKIYRAFEGITSENSKITFHIDSSLEEEILKEFLVNTPLYKS